MCKLLSICLFVCVMSALATALNKVYKLKNLTVNFFTLITKLNKDDNSHSSGACFYILVCRWDINFKDVISFFSYFSTKHMLWVLIRNAH